MKDQPQELHRQVCPIADMLVPIFFVTVDAKTNLEVLNPVIPHNLEGLFMAIFLIVAAIAGKVITGFSVFSQSQISRLAMSVGMIPRGAIGLVFAGVGAVSGVPFPSCTLDCQYPIPNCEETSTLEYPSPKIMNFMCH